MHGDLGGALFTWIHGREDTLLGRYFRLWLALAKFSLLHELAFRANFLVKIVVEIMWLSILLLFYHTIFTKTDVVATWSPGQYLFFVGTYFAMGGLIETLFLENCNQFAELVRTGDLDFYLIKPIDEQFLISFRSIDWSCAPNILMGLGVMLYALRDLVLTLLGRAEAPGSDRPSRSID